MSEKRELSDTIKILLFILTLGAWYFFYVYKRAERKKELDPQLFSQIKQALDELDNYLNTSQYYAQADSIQLSVRHRHLLQSIPKNFENLAIATVEINLISKLINNYQNLENLREQHNENFIKQEMRAYADFFSTLDNYPLSEEQMRAVICNEDHTLVIAGAGTGKTTTISAKAAYILKKQLCRPEELLIISFTNNAVDELADRTMYFCRNIPGREEISFKTFNGFGNSVTSFCSPYPAKLAFEGRDILIKSFLRRSFNELFYADASFQSRAINFIAFFSNPLRDEFSFASPEEFLAYSKNAKHISLNGLQLRSATALQIANFLYLHGVSFQYEAPYPNINVDIKAQLPFYAPAFFLPEYNIYLEHFCVNEDGNVPNWFSYRPPFSCAREQYHAEINTKEEIHKLGGSHLIKTYSYQAMNNGLLKHLKHELLSRGVALKKMEAVQIHALIKKSAVMDQNIDLIFSFLNLTKSNNTLTQSVQKNEDKRSQLFQAICTPLLHRYQQELQQTASIDYHDMVHLATGFITSGAYPVRYKYILVDEFQDMSLSRYRMIKALLQANPGSRLYAVGDDWQSIFRFAGSDVSLFTQFEAYFGHTAYHTILNTYRFNAEILKVSSNFIQKNPIQIKKQLQSPFRAHRPSFVLKPFHTGRMKNADRDIQIWDVLRNILEEISDFKHDAEVFIIGRYHHNSPGDLPQFRRLFPRLRIRFHTAHSCKGLSCDFTIILGLDSGRYGFPSGVTDDPILAAVLQNEETFELAEERRLFYVALTRARERIYLVYNPSAPSRFITELKADHDIQEAVMM
ncbi:UvrD-helicase domain-containing protein [Pedobacter rhizosphaerae]|uniref:DNA 3'-5' helicase n=1 Tax=Pedobacter rhizosphaerae TaxID=390241 RepID=A0A1H9SFZ6_9SPHI|nr:UvrD-helicase domain-containing protein [Pedobacter rhizosphaerae]SER83956.1 DNA helicase-4 [Pedobacter rhizosphaerae]